MSDHWDFFLSQSVRYAPPVAQHVSLHGETLYKKIAHESGVADNTYPISRGARTEKILKFCFRKVSDFELTNRIIPQLSRAKLFIKFILDY